MGRHGSDQLGLGIPKEDPCSVAAPPTDEGRTIRLDHGESVLLPDGELDGAAPGASSGSLAPAERQRNVLEVVGTAWTVAMKVLCGPQAVTDGLVQSLGSKSSVQLDGLPKGACESGERKLDALCEQVRPLWFSLPAADYQIMVTTMEFQFPPTLDNGCQRELTARTHGPICLPG